MIANPVAPFHTLAELHRQLGEVPLDRIRLHPSPGTATETDLRKTGRPLCELIDGVLVEKAMGDRESLLAFFLGRRIGNHVEAHDLGHLLGADGYIRIDHQQIRAPDVTFIPWANFPGEQLPEEAYWSVTPGLIVEVLSPGNTLAEIDRKLGEFFGIGCPLAWIIDPVSQTAKVYSSPSEFVMLTRTDGVLDGGTVLPGFSLPLAEVFAVITRKPKGK